MLIAVEGLPKGCAYSSESYASQAHGLRRREAREGQGDRGFYPRQAPGALRPCEARCVHPPPTAHPLCRRLAAAVSNLVHAALVS